MKGRKSDNELQLDYDWEPMSLPEYFERRSMILALTVGRATVTVVIYPSFGQSL